MVNYWNLSISNDVFFSLEAAKEHLEESYSLDERLSYLRGAKLVHYVNDIPTAYVEIHVTEKGNLAYSVPHKY